MSSHITLQSRSHQLTQLTGFAMVRCAASQRVNAAGDLASDEANEVPSARTFTLVLSGQRVFGVRPNRVRPEPKNSRQPLQSQASQKPTTRPPRHPRFLRDGEAWACPGSARSKAFAPAAKPKRRDGAAALAQLTCVHECARLSAMLDDWATSFTGYHAYYASRSGAPALKLVIDVLRAA